MGNIPNKITVLTGADEVGCQTFNKKSFSQARQAWIVQLSFVNNFGFDTISKRDITIGIGFEIRQITLDSSHVSGTLIVKVPILMS